MNKKIWVVEYTNPINIKRKVLIDAISLTNATVIAEELGIDGRGINKVRLAEWPDLVETTNHDDNMKYILRSSIGCFGEELDNSGLTEEKFNNIQKKLDDMSYLTIERE